MPSAGGNAARRVGAALTGETLMSKELVIIGNGQMAELLCSHFTRTSDYRVAGFAVDATFIKAGELLGLPVVALEEVESRFAPDAFDAFVAIGPAANNTVISPDASVGENVVVGPFSTVQPWARIGDNVLVGGSSIVGHHCQVHSHAYLALHVVMAGSVVIGERAFVGIGATIRDNVKIGEGSVIGAGATILSDVAPNSVHVPPRATQLPMSADQVRL